MYIAGPALGAISPSARQIREMARCDLGGVPGARFTEIMSHHVA